jgi:putative ubiquitin-RnfH superfamily antitoxin RatB of RatAB toxin-antitoxin module
MTAPPLAVTVVFAAPGVEAIVAVDVPAGATVSDAIARSGLAARLNLDSASLEFAIFGQRVNADTPLAEGDRVELTRPLVVDPMDVRRQRATRAQKS